MSVYCFLTVAHAIKQSSFQTPTDVRASMVLATLSKSGFFVCHDGAFGFSVPLLRKWDFGRANNAVMSSCSGPSSSNPRNPASTAAARIRDLKSSAVLGVYMRTKPPTTVPRTRGCPLGSPSTVKENFFKSMFNWSIPCACEHGLSNLCLAPRWVFALAAPREQLSESPLRSISARTQRTLLQPVQIR